MERYEAYKDSGIEWIGEIPAEWNIKRIKYLATDESSLFIDGDWIESKDIVFDDSQIRYITTGNIGEGWYKEQGLAHITNEKFIALNCTEIFPGDLIISRLNPPIGRSCIVPDLGARIVTSVDNVILRPDTKYRKKYLMYSMCNYKYFEYTSLIARGATMQRISRSLLGDVALPIPSGVEEQTAITNFLDRKTAEIDALIAQKERLLELYEKEKSAIINHAVTKGLDPDAELKESGVEWIGELPAAWEVMKLKYIASLKTGYTPSKEKKENYSDNGITWVKPNDLKGFSPVVGSKEKVSKLGLKVQNIVPNGSLLVCCIGSIGKFGIAGSLLITNQQINALVFNNFVTDAFSKFLIAASINEHQRHANGNVVKILNIETQGSIFFPIPPKDEQTAIANFLDRKMTEIDAKITKTQRIIELQKEYRTALISEVVTGKIKVPQLPTQEASA